MKSFAIYFVYSVALLTFSFSARAADDTEFKNSGEFRMRYINNFNATGQDSSGQMADTFARFKLNIAARKGENLQAYISALHVSEFGSQNTDNGDYSTVNTNSTSNTAATNNLLLVSRAWGLWKATDTLSFRVGRFGINIADGLVFSDNDWENVPTAHEGLEAAFDTDYAKLSVFFVKTNELALPPLNQSGAPNSDPERNFYLLTADVKNLPDVIKTANLHVLAVTRDRTDDGQNPPVKTYGGQTWQHIGLTLGGDFHGFIYKATGAYQQGYFSRMTSLDQRISAYMYDVLIGWEKEENAKVKITAGLHVDTGNESSFNATSSDKTQRYQTLYYQEHDTAGLMDLIRWGNLTYWHAEAIYTPTEDFEAGLRYLSFSQTQAGDPSGISLGDRFSGIGLSTVAVGERNIGSEIDIFGSKSYDGGFKIGVEIAGFLTGDYFKAGTIHRDRPILQGLFEGSFEF